MRSRAKLRQKLRIQFVLAGQGVAFDQLEIRTIRESAAQQGGQIAIDFDGDDLPRASEQFFGERPGSRPHFNNQILRPEFAGLGDQPHEILVDHEILPKPLPRLRPRLGQECFDLVFGLGQGEQMISCQLPVVSCLRKGLFEEGTKGLRNEGTKRGRDESYARVRSLVPSSLTPFRHNTLPNNN